MYDIIISSIVNEVIKTILFFFTKNVKHTKTQIKPKPTNKTKISKQKTTKATIFCAKTSKRDKIVYFAFFSTQNLFLKKLKLSR